MGATPPSCGVQKGQVRRGLWPRTPQQDGPAVLRAQPNWVRWGLGGGRRSTHFQELPAALWGRHRNRARRLRMWRELQAGEGRAQLKELLVLPRIWYKFWHAHRIY